jgi:hypothetical protein
MTLNMWSPPSDEDANVITKSVWNAAHAAQNESGRLYWLIRSQPEFRRDSSVRSVCAARSPVGVHSPYRLRILSRRVTRRQRTRVVALHFAGSIASRTGRRWQRDCMSNLPRFSQVRFVSDGAIIREQTKLIKFGSKTGRTPTASARTIQHPADRSSSANTRSHSRGRLH